MIQQLVVPVVSAIFPTIFEDIQVDGANSWHEACRLAMHFAQRELRMAAPVVPISEHEFAVKQRRAILAANRQPMPTERPSVPFHRQPEPRGAMYAK